MTILPAPPPDWKRPAMPKGVKATVFQRQGGKCAESDVKIGVGFEPCEYDHRPPLFARQFDTEARGGKGDTIPACNDPAFIQAVTCAVHKMRTSGPGYTSYGSDAHERAKGKRITGKKAARFSGPPRGVDIGTEPVREPKKPGKTIQSRGFDKTRRRKLNGEVEVRT